MTRYDTSKDKALRVYLKLADKVLHPKDNVLPWGDFERFAKYQDKLVKRLR